MKCPKCQREITRKRGNLCHASWINAIKAMLSKHLETCQGGAT